MPMDILLLVVAGALLVFMFVSSNRRRKKMQEEEQKRQAQLLPGTPVMTRAGIYGTLVSFDADDLTKRAVVAIAPGVEIEVHAQTVTVDQETYDAQHADDEPAYENVADEPSDLDIIDPDAQERRDVVDGSEARDETLDERRDTGGDDPKKN